MGILANALPGFRDLRSPLIAGYIWLGMVWLIIRPDVSHRPSGTVNATLWDLGHDLGRIGISIAVSVAAYLIGSISLDMSDTALKVLLRGRVAGGYAYRLAADLDVLYARGRNLIADRDDLVAEETEYLVRWLDRRHEDARDEVFRELELPATVLIEDREQLFAEVDRLRSEGELRIAVFAPLLALDGFLTGSVGAICALAVPALLILLWQGIRRTQDSKRVIADAITMRLLRSPALHKFESWVEGLSTRRVLEEELHLA